MSQPQTGTLADLAVWLFACAVGQPVQVCSVCPQTGEPIDRSAYYLERCLELAVTLLANAPYMERGQCDYAGWNPSHRTHPRAAASRSRPDPDG